MMKSRKLAIGLLLMLAIVVTTGSFAYWNNVTGDTSTAASATVTIGSGETQATTLTFSAFGDDGSTALVPTAYAATPTVEDTIVFTIPVSWDEEASSGANGATGTLSILSDTFVLLNLTDAEIDAMFSVTYDFTAAITAGDATDTTVTITLVFDTEPIDEATYDLVATKILELQVVFEVVAD